MVFIIQNTQNRDNLAMNLKMDVILKKLDADTGDILEAEEKKDKYLEKQVKKAQNGSHKGQRSR
jgi:low affinity Fe/Cu permease